MCAWELDARDEEYRMKQTLGQASEQSIDDTRFTELADAADDVRKETRG